MKIMGLDSNGDWIFGEFKENLPALLQNIKSRLLQVKGDCFYDLDDGIDWFVSNRPSEYYIAEVKRVILQTEGVVRITNFEVIEGENKTLFLRYTIDSIYTSNITDIFNFYGNI